MNRPDTYLMIKVFVGNFIHKLIPPPEHSLIIHFIKFLLQGLENCNMFVIARSISVAVFLCCIGDALMLVAARASVR